VGIGGSGGSGVLLVKRGEDWSDPAFYNIGSIGIGAQIGAEAGSIAMVLNNDKAVNSFMKPNNFSLSADAGLTVVDWSKMAQGSVGAGDVVVWSSTKGLFGDVAAINVNDVRFNKSLTNAYYHETVSAKDVIGGKAKNSKSDELKQALAATGSGTTSGGSSTPPSGNKSGEK
jgi:lipid-binding SYLF domain-containing protein